MSGQQVQAGSRKSRERALRDELRAGIGRGELVPYYMPIVSVRHRSVLRLEALARWQHPDRGVVDPRDFIPVAERHGLMPALTDAILERAIADLRARRATLPSLRVSINLSAHSLRDPHLAETLSRRLAVWGGSPDWLAFEITESLLVSDPELARTNIERLKHLGARVEIDDFGTGYSSLRYLQLLPVDAVKIDRQFVAATFRDRQSEVIVRTVIGMCHELGFEAVAEGVEAPEVWGLMKALGCDAAQGYLISPPLSARDIASWLATLPHARPDVVTMERTADGRAIPSRSHILVVDDEPAILSLVTEVLAEHGYRVETAANGEEALASMARQRPGLVLLDVHMPVLDGEGFVSEMRSRGLDVPVIILTAGPSAELWEKRLGAQGAVQKPFRIPDLINAATRFLVPADLAPADSLH
jgi:EAL domain-containing protein (putative c-di-GMP-specific phosphodiesterase class I)/CheY-like chemotaxis protein